MNVKPCSSSVVSIHVLNHDVSWMKSLLTCVLAWPPAAMSQWRFVWEEGDQDDSAILRLLCATPAYVCMCE